ncbi:MAG TPA: ECF transporter S component [Clostridium sp.]
MELSKDRSKSKVRDMVETALLISLVFVATAFINIKLPILSSGGLVHLGTGMLFISAIVFGKKKAAIAGAVGMAIFDLTGAWALWAPFTFVVRGAMGYVMGAIAYSNNKKGNSIMLNILGIVVSGAVMIVGYYITEGIIYGNWLTPVASIPGNLTQIVVGSLLALPIAKILKRYAKHI